MSDGSTVYIVLFYTRVLLSPIITANHMISFFVLPGRFDFSNYTVVCSCCSYKLDPMSLEKIISAGYWPGSPKDCSYLFHQDLFRQWDFLQKRLPGTSEVAFLKSLGDFSQSRGRVGFFSV